jgi:flagellar hook-associated protein 3 FlgL
VAATLDDLDRDLDRILKVASEVGARINTYQRQQQSLEDMEVDLMETISEYQDADVARVFSDLVNQQTVYEAALRSTAMITRVNLMDFIQ